jgi:hypothetical protein
VSTKCSIIDSKESIYLVGILTQLHVHPNTLEEQGALILDVYDSLGFHQP